jgi:PKD repeat protein
MLYASVATDTTYSWTESDGNSGTGNNYAVMNIPSSPNPYSVNVTSTYMNCTSAASTVTIAVNSLPTVSFTLVQDTAPHTWDVYPTYSSDVIQYSWNWGDSSAYSTTAYPNHTYGVAGLYDICVTAINANGCASRYCQNDSVYRLTNSSMIQVNVLNGQATGIKQVVSNNGQIIVYPNPASNSITLQSRAELGTIIIYNALGEIVLQIESKNRQEQIDVNQFLPGIYTVQIQNRISKLIKQ